MLRIIHEGITLATHLLVSLLETSQVRVETAMAWKRLRQVKAIGGTLTRTNTALVDTVLYAETILSATPLWAENSFWIAWFCRAPAQTVAA